MDLPKVSSRRHSYHLSPRNRLSATFIVPETPRKSNAHTSSRSLVFGTFSSKELDRIEENLDQREIQLNNFHVNSESCPEEDFEVYREYLQELAYLIRVKDSRLALSITRGLKGLSKAFQRSVSRNSIRSTNTRETQTAGCNSGLKKPRTPADITALKTKIREMEQGNITNCLKKLYAGLQKLKTEVPDLSDDPNEFQLEFGAFTEQIERNFAKLTNELKATAARKKRHDEGVQVGAEDLYKVLAEKREEEISKLRQKLSELSESQENFWTAEEIEELKRQFRLSAEEAKCFQTLSNKMQTSIMSMKFEGVKKEAQVTRRNHNAKIYKAVLPEIHGQNVEKINQLQQIENELYQSQSANLVLQEKLSQLETAWAKISRQEFDYKVPMIHELTRKAGLKKLNFKEIYKEELTGAKLKRMTSQLQHSNESSEDELENISALKGKPPIQRQLAALYNDQDLSSLYQPEESHSEEPPLPAPQPHNTSKKVVKASKNEIKLEKPTIKRVKKAKASEKEKPLEIVRERPIVHSSSSEEESSECEPYDFSKFEKIPMDSEDVLEAHVNELQTTVERWDSKLQERTLFTLRNTGQSTLTKLKQQLAVLRLSKGVQCTPAAASRNKQHRARNMKSSHPEEFDEESDSHEDLRPVVTIKKSKRKVEGPVSPLYQNRAERVDTPTKKEVKLLKHIPGLSKVFAHSHELDGLTTQQRRELLHSLKGHSAATCGTEICEHLRRAMALRAKFRGIPYPLKHSTLCLDS